MSTALRIIMNIVVGVVIGIALVFMAVATSLVLAFFAQAPVNIPGIIGIWSAEQNNAIALNFDPNFVGMGIAILVIAALYAVLMTRFSPRRAA